MRACGADLQCLVDASLRENRLIVDVEVDHYHLISPVLLIVTFESQIVKFQILQACRSPTIKLYEPDGVCRRAVRPPPLSGPCIHIPCDQFLCQMCGALRTVILLDFAHHEKTPAWLLGACRSRSSFSRRDIQADIRLYPRTTYLRAGRRHVGADRPEETRRISLRHDRLFRTFLNKSRKRFPSCRCGQSQFSCGQHRGEMRQIRRRRSYLDDASQVRRDIRNRLAAYTCAP